MTANGFDRTREPLPLGFAWFCCPRCHEAWALADNATPNCGECLTRDVKIVPMRRVDPQCPGCEGASRAG
jgi:hypothetical protein